MSFHIPPIFPSLHAAVGWLHSVLFPIWVENHIQYMQCRLFHGGKVVTTPGTISNDIVESLTHSIDFDCISFIKSKFLSKVIAVIGNVTFALLSSKISIIVLMDFKKLLKE